MADFPLPAMFSDWNSWAMAFIAQAEQNNLTMNYNGSGQAPLGYQPVWRDADGTLIDGNIAGSEPLPGEEFVIEEDNLGDEAVSTDKIKATNVSNVGYTELTAGGTLGPYTLDTWQNFDTVISGGTAGAGGGTGGSAGGGGEDTYPEVPV